MVEVNDLAFQRISEDTEALKKIGFAPPSLYYDLGSQVKASKTGFMRQRTEWEAQPKAGPALDKFKKLVKEQKMREVIVNPGEIAMHPDGSVQLATGRYFPTTGVFNDLVGHISGDEKYAGPNLQSQPPEFRSMNFNRMAYQFETNPDRKKFKVGLREGASGTEIFRASSMTYRAFTPDRIASVISKYLKKAGLEDQARVMVRYDGELTKIDVTFFNNHDISESGCGDVFKFGLRLKTSEVKSSSLVVDLVAFINQCLNYICIATPTKLVGKARHSGHTNMEAKLEAMIEAALSQATPILERWDVVSKDDLESRLKTTGPEETFKVLVNRGYGRVPGVKDEHMVQALVTAWEFNPGKTRAHYINGLTRAAHTVWTPSVWTPDIMEQQAGKLLQTVKVSAIR